MNEIKTELEFKTILMRAVKYMTSKGSESVDMDISDKVRIKLSLELIKWPKHRKNVIIVMH